ncbi:hypothetical protein [Allomuricauda sp. F6463D]|uniref:hypothetical protein n=1 Tax=Allomuricauda sp. F6463D TaxID=2926409 RepID=UPI001FF20694|nr:hypothetical protein [Muricauda sp. F6463D]MCK0159432.1 hypothetical protein [Muricauda sp. F6463D]
MKQKKCILLLLIVSIFTGCNNEQDNKVQINPFDELGQVDSLLLEIAEKPQYLVVPSDRKTTLTGSKGTIIHIDPSRLETDECTPLGDNIKVELLEMTNNSSMLSNNAPTISNGQILVTGGAYYLNMTSDGKQLKIKQGEGLEVEFPKLTDDEMGLFLGERDSLGQINWIPTNDSFKPKRIKDAQEPQKPVAKQHTGKTNSMDPLFEYTERYTAAPEPKKQQVISEKEYLTNKTDYEKQQKQIDHQRKTYEAVELMNFGWINCDRFYNDSSPKTDIQLLVKNDSLTGVRMYAVFSDMNSIISEQYWKGRKNTVAFRNIPIGKNLKIIALSAKNETPYIFETTINTSTDKHVEIEFEATTQADIMEKMKRLN